MWLLQTSVCLSLLRADERGWKPAPCPYNRAQLPDDPFQHLQFP